MRTNLDYYLILTVLAVCMFFAAYVLHGNGQYICALILGMVGAITTFIMLVVKPDKD